MYNIRYSCLSSEIRILVEKVNRFNYNTKMSKFIERNRRQLVFAGGSAVVGFIGGRLLDKHQQPITSPEIARFNKEKEARDANLAIRLQATQCSSYIIPEGQNPVTMYDDIYHGK